MNLLSELLSSDLAPLEIILRGTLVYWFLFILFRYVLRRDAGALGIADVLLVVLIADAAQNGMSGTYNTVLDGFLLVATLAFWNFLFDWLAYTFPTMERWLEPPPICLVRNGRMVRRNMRRQLVTEAELMGKLRQGGIDQLRDVRRAFMESDGHISVLTYRNGGDAQ